MKGLQLTPNDRERLLELTAKELAARIFDQIQWGVYWAGVPGRILEVTGRELVTRIASLLVLHLTKESIETIVEKALTTAFEKELARMSDRI